MCGKTPRKPYRKAPGPGRYEYKTSMVGMKGVNKFGRGKRRGFYELKRTPGPGVYKIKKDKDSKYFNKPRAMFGKEHQRKPKHDELVPGPARYSTEHLDFARSNLNKQKGYSGVPKRPQSAKKWVPGPGKYFV